MSVIGCYWLLAAELKLFSKPVHYFLTYKMIQHHNPFGLTTRKEVRSVLNIMCYSLFSKRLYKTLCTPTYYLFSEEQLRCSQICICIVQNMSSLDFN